MLGWFVETTLVASGLAVVAALASRLRSIGPTARHALWLVVLIKMMTPPLVCWPWAAPWGDLDWLFISPAVAHAAPVECAGDIAGDCLAPPAPLSETTTLAAVARRAGLDPSRIGKGLAPAVTPRVVDAPSEAAPDASASPRPVPDPGAKPAKAARVPGALAVGWLVLTVLLGVGQASRIIRFRRRLRAAVPAPDGLVEEAGRIARWLGVRVPELLVVPDLGTPLLWCLGRPKLLLPAPLVKVLDRDRWRGILTHELAHLRRGDHWVSRLELAAGLIWWWNPVYWLARARLDAEAELACDAWVVWTLPKHRLAYAEALFDICSTLSLAKAPAPALGAAGSGRFFERRLTMILHGHVPCRLSPWGLLVACLLALFALPSWSAAKPVADDSNGAAAAVSFAQTVDQASTASIVDDDDDDVDDDDDDADDDDDDADDDDDDDASRARAKSLADAKKALAEAIRAQADAKKAKADKAKARVDKAKAKSDKAKAKSDKVKAEADAKKKEKFEVEVDTGRIEKELESKFGPEFEKKMEALGEKIEKEIESKFGPEFEKKMEALGKELGDKLGPGSDFEKSMKVLGKELGDKLGPGSDFEKSMKEFGKEMESKFGPGSDFEKSMKEFGKEMESKFGPGSDFEKKVKEQAEKLGSDLRKKVAKKPSTSEDRSTGGGKAEAKAPAVAKDRQRERRIAALEAQIRKLSEELKALAAEGDQD